ncbi:type VI secretion protein, EvpB/ family, partial [Candidatus Magnetomorum sp. HK-1]
ERITESFSKNGWCAAIRGVEGGGLVEGLPLYTYDIDENTVIQKCPTEMQITDRKEKELSDLGFIPLVHCKNTDYAAFFGTQTLNKPTEYDTPQATANARLSSQLQYILCVSRFSHYLKSMMRDLTGSFMSVSQVGSYLNRWLNQYVCIDDDAGQEIKAQFPLREARVDVLEIQGKPGCYKATVYLKPHYQLEELTISMRLVSELPPPANKN